MEYRCSRADSRFDEEKNMKALSEKSSEKRSSSHTRGSGIVFGFRRRPTSGIPLPIANYSTADTPLFHQRSKSAGPDHTERSRENDDIQQAYTSQSGRSTPRLAPPKKESSGLSVRTNRFGFRQPQPRYTNKVSDICNSHGISHYNQEKQQSQQLHLQQPLENQLENCKPRSNHQKTRNNHTNPQQQRLPSENLSKLDRKTSSIPEPVSRYTLHTSHLPLPQYAVRVSDTNAKVAKTVANQNRKSTCATTSSTFKVSGGSKEGSGTEDSGIGSNQGQGDRVDRSLREFSEQVSGRRSHGKPRNLRMVVNGQSFDVRDVREDDSTVTEISVIMLPKSFANPNVSTGLVRERTMQYQRVLNKDNRYTDSTTSMSTTSSEGYDEGLGEEKVYKDRSRSEKLSSNRKPDLSPLSSDDPEYGHGEAMADEYSLSSSDDCQRSISEKPSPPKTTLNPPKNGTLRSVLLTIEDPAFAAVAATSTTLIDDETSPVDSLFDSPTASLTQSEGQNSRKTVGNVDVMENSGNTIEDEGPGTPTNASNSLSLSEGREYFDDEIADQPGLIFDDTSRTVALENTSVVGNQCVTENSYTLVETHSKQNQIHGRSVENSPLHARRMSRAGSIGTLSPCESIASDDLMLDYERSDTSSYEETHQRTDTSTALHELDDATIISELEAQGEEVMRQWTSLLGTAQAQQRAANSNSINNNVNTGICNNNNQSTTDTGISSGRTSKLLRNRSGTESPRSLDSVRIRQIPSPLRTPKSAQSPNLDSGDEGSIRIDREGYQSMFQDIVSIKTMLLKLKRVLQESGENGLTRADTLNPFGDATKNGLFYSLNEGGTIDVSTSPGENNIVDELSDLRRQVIFLQGQVEEKDRTIQSLRFQMSKLRTSNGGDSRVSSPLKNRAITSDETCNAATQTEKIRPVSAGPSILQSNPQDGNMGPLVSWNHRNAEAVSSQHLPQHLSQHLSQHLPRQNGQLIEKPTPPPPSVALCRRIPIPREIVSNRSSDVVNFLVDSDDANKPETSVVRSKFNVATKRFTANTLIPRASRTVSVAARSHNAL